jgi:hypothetical protein
VLADEIDAAGRARDERSFSAERLFEAILQFRDVHGEEL